MHKYKSNCTIVRRAHHNEARFQVSLVLINTENSQEFSSTVDGKKLNNCSPTFPSFFAHRT